MRDMWGEKSCGRTRFNAFTITIVVLLTCAILGTTIFFNWIYIVEFFKETKSKIIGWFKKDEIVRDVDDSETHITAEEFDDMILKIEQLEELSKEYDEADYQLRVMKYIRSGNSSYNNAIWKVVAGEADTDFANYVVNNQGNKKLSDLKNIKTFEDPSTGENVDFTHLFAVMNIISLGNASNIDLGGWGGDLIQLVNQFKDSTESDADLKNKIKEAFAGDSETSTFSGEDVCADFDAVNIMKNFDSNVDTIAESLEDYYSSVTPTSRINDFKTTTFSGGYLSLAQLKTEIFNRLKNNTYIVILAGTYNLDFTTHAKVIDLTVEVFANYLYPDLV